MATKPKDKKAETKPTITIPRDPETDAVIDQLIAEMQRRIPGLKITRSAAVLFGLGLAAQKLDQDVPQTPNK